jgi:serine/threonine protein kinase
MADDDSTRRADADDYLTRKGLAAGRRVFGRYVLEAELGAGGMGVVWRARDEELSDLVALKFLPEVVARDAAAVDELREETRNALRLTHPNIVRIRNFEREGSVAAVSMEYVDGTTLSHLRLQRPGKVFSAEGLAPLVAQLCAALDYAHREAKVVHRDLKPANILVTKDGAAKITDFGIARSLSETSTRLTGKDGATSGTLLYMSPQQVAGKKATPADDIYALGATLYELLTGKPPFYTGDITHQILRQAPAGLAARRAELGVKNGPVPPAWEETILACLAKEPQDRPRSAGEVARRLGVGVAKVEVPDRAGSSLMDGRGAERSEGPMESRMPKGGTASDANAGIGSPDDTISRRSNKNSLVVAGVLVSSLALYLAGVALVKVSSLGKRVPENLPDQLASLESSSSAAATAADKASKDIVQLTRSTQAAFDSIGPEIGNIKQRVEELRVAQQQIEDYRTVAGDSYPLATTMVMSGDTAVRIAKRLGVSIQELEDANPGIDWRHLYVGQRIIYPQKTEVNGQ